MPELPEVETVVRSVAAHLTGRRIVSTQFTSRFVTPGSRAKLSERLAGRRIESVTRRGKFILIALDQGTLTVHLGMTGKLLVEGEASEHTHGNLYAGQRIAAVSRPPPVRPDRMERRSEPPRVARLGPEPLEISFEEFRARLRRKAGMKALLLNQAFLAGLGNIYADESLFAAGIHPLANAAKLSDARAKKLYEAIRGILAHAIKLGGSSISDYVNGRGERGWFQVEHRAYGREGEPCVNCGRPIRKILVAQRGTHYCPHCQKK